MLLENTTGPYAKALLNNHGAMPFDVVLPFPSEPVQTTASQQDNDGVVTLATAGITSTPNRLQLVPYAEGVPGDQFSMRVWAIRIFTPGDRNVDHVVWMPTLLGEYLCTVCNRPGPQWPNSGLSQRVMVATENCCDTITLTHGFLGLKGCIVSPGSDVVPGLDLTASIVQELFGAPKIYFDFQPENGFTGTMNCAYGKA